MTEAFKQGERAFAKNVSYHNCPYAHGTADYLEWRCGWREAEYYAYDGY